MFNYKKKLPLFIFTILSIALSSQKRGLILQQPKLETKDNNETNLDGESAKIQQVIDDLFDAMRISSGANVSHLFETGATMSSIGKSQLGQTTLRNDNAQSFINALAKPRQDQWDERLWSYDINVDGPLAKAWTPYTFFVNGKISHCGVNDFELVNKSGTWKINRVIDTRRTTECKTDPNEAINQLMDNWHNAAAVADENIFFNSMSSDGIYVGTDASERWTREELRLWSKPYFQRNSAWNFKAKNRNVTLSEDGETAWADEVLDTWMGDCRSSVVLVKEEEDWKIKYFHVAIAVPNNAVDGYLKLIGKPRN